MQSIANKLVIRNRDPNLSGDKDLLYKHLEAHDYKGAYSVFKKSKSQQNLAYNIYITLGEEGFQGVLDGFARDLGFIARQRLSLSLDRELKRVEKSAKRMKRQMEAIKKQAALDRKVSQELMKLTFESP